MKEFRCGCGRLLAKVENKPTHIQIKCPRCGILNHWNVMNVGSDSHELPLKQENKHDYECKNGRKSSPV